MLTTKRINLIICTFCRLLRIGIILYSAVIIANCVWWVLSPADTNIFIQWADLDVHDKATGYVNNRHPFGVIASNTAKGETPHIVDQLKLTGVYLNIPKDSFAFLEYQGKPIIVHIGEEIADSGAVVKSINPDSIVVIADGDNATINITAGTAVQSNAPMSRSLNDGNSETAFGRRSNGDDPDNSPRTNSAYEQPSTSRAMENFRQRRRKLLEEYRLRRANRMRADPSTIDDD